MITSKILTGDQLVAKGTTKSATTLPEFGLKDITPNGSWLEQKQIQSALEARKHLIEVERIEKSGTLSHAEWLEELMLANVTKKVGSYWQYLGHSVGKKLFLYPEEALFLMEINCLQLKHNGVTVSLQQSYSLLLRGKISLDTYQVYASLSRVGYRVFRHEDNISKTNVLETKIKTTNVKGGKTTTIDKSMEEDGNKVVIDNIKINNDIKSKREEPPKAVKSTSCNNDKSCHQYLQINNYSILQNLESRRLRTRDLKDFHRYFENIPDISRKHVITVKAPNPQYVPQNINTKTEYVLDMGQITQRHAKSSPNNSRTYSETDEVNGDHVRRVRSSSAYDQSSSSGTSQFYSNNRFSRQNINTQFRPFSFWRPQSNFQFNFIYQRPLFPNFPNFNTRFQYFRSPFYRPLPNFCNSFGNTTYQNINISNLYNHRQDNKKRRWNSSRNLQLDTIKNMAIRVQLLTSSRNTEFHDLVRSLHKIIQTYNTKYGSRLRLTDQLDIIDDDLIVETIEVDDDEESRAKKPKTDDNTNTFDENLNKIRQVALKLKIFESDNRFCAIHKRALSRLIKTFNKSYNADIYLNNNYEILDRKYITLDSSDSDCVIDELPVGKPFTKKLKNPLNILKRLSEKKNWSNRNNLPSTSKANNVTENTDVLRNDSYSEMLLKIFNKNWLPKENIFGRAEVSPLTLMNTRLMDCKREELIYSFNKNLSQEYESWLNLKIYFWKSFEEATAAFQRDISELDCIIKPEDCTDMSSVLKKLSIIETNKNVASLSKLRIDFDVYNRDVQNFRKSCRPTPHFRIVCMSESTNFPSGEDIATLHSKNTDNVTIMFAVVGIGSIIYMQMNNIDLPIYIPGSELT